LGGAAPGLSWPAQSGGEDETTRIGALGETIAAVAALPPRSQEELLDAIKHSIDAQPPTDWSKVTNLGMMRAVSGVKKTVNLATQYVKAGYDPQALIARLAEIVCHDNFTEMHAFKHHQSIVEEYHSTREPWRWMHLVCGAQAAAIYFGKNMTVYRSTSNSSTPLRSRDQTNREASRLPVCAPGVQTKTAAGALCCPRQPRSNLLEYAY